MKILLAAITSCAVVTLAGPPRSRAGGAPAPDGWSFPSTTVAASARTEGMFIVAFTGLAAESGGQGRGRRRRGGRGNNNEPAEATPTPAATPLPTPAAPASSTSTRIDELIERKTVLSDDIFGSLEKPVPPSIRDYLADLRENLLDEGARHPVAAPPAYDLGARYCNGLIAAYDERAQMEARLRNNAPTRAAGAPTTTKLHPNWIDYARERDEANAAAHNNTIETAFARMNINQWNQRAGELRKNLDAFYTQFRAAARQPVPAKTS